MESFKLPMREIARRYTKSEIVIQSWASEETSFKMKKKMKDPASKRKESIILTDLDLSKVTDREARQHLASMGLEFPIAAP